MLWEFVSKLIILVTKSIFKLVAVVLILFIIVSQTNIGGSMDMLKSKYYSTTGNSLSPDEVLVDLEGQVTDSVQQIDNVNDMFQ